MLAFLSGLIQRLRSVPEEQHRHMGHDNGIRKVRSLNNGGLIQASVNIQNQTRHAYVTASVSGNGSFRQQIREVLETCRAALLRADVSCPVVLRQEIFLADVGQIEACRQEIADFYGENIPVTTFVPQTPCNGRAALIEVMAVDESAEGQRRDDRLLVVRHDGVTWVHGAYVKPERSPRTAYDRSYSAFLTMRNMLRRENLKIGDLVRTWLYQGDIVGPEYDTQRYKELNRARTDFFEGVTFANGMTPPEYQGVVYPASTGIGADDSDVVMGFLALDTKRSDVVVVPLENPEQTSAFDYAAVYSPKSPKFARAMAVVVGGTTGVIFVSGTASITGSESRHIDDVQAQTHQTIDNIQALIDRDNMQRHGIPGLGAGLGDMAVVRAYVKRRGDYEAVRAICEERFGPDVPVIYTYADVCRDELLVEIEGIAFPREYLQRTQLI